MLGAADGELIVIHANYIYIVKFRLKLDSEYKIVLGYLRMMAARAGNAISRW